MDAGEKYAAPSPGAAFFCLLFLYGGCWGKGWGDMLDTLKRLGQRKLAQWALAYAAAAWVALQVLGLAADSYGWSPSVMRVAFGVAVVGFIVALVLAWYHGERGQQKATGAELLLLAAVLVAGGGLIWNSERQRPPSSVVANSAAATSASAASTPVAQIAPTDTRSIAVLPFVNLSSDPEQEYFSDGLSEDLITALSQFNGLKVISRNSSFTFRDSKQDSATIGAKLGVAHLLAGSVRRAGDVVRISADLVNVADGRTLWSQRFDRPYTNLFQLQDEITQAVANELKAKLLTDEGAVMQSDRPPSGSLAAYNAYLQGRYQFARSTHPSFQQAIGFYEQAIRLDPGYAAAHAALGATLSFDAAIFSSGDAARAQLDRSRRAVRTALALAPDLAAAHIARGALLMNGELDWAAAETEYRLAIRLAPNDSAGLYGLAQARAALGMRDEAIALMQQAIDRDPLDTGRYYWLSILKSTPGNLAEAERLIDIAVKLQPAAEQGVSQKVAVQVLRGQHAAALATVRAMPTGVWRAVSLAYATQGAGNPAAADAALQALIDHESKGAAYQIAQVFALRKDPEGLFKWLDQAWTNRDPGIRRTLFDPFLAPYRSDPRFAAFCKKVRLPAPGA